MIPSGITSTCSKGFSGYKEFVQTMGRSFRSVRLVKVRPKNPPANSPNVPNHIPPICRPL
jgi:hypothetical protein